MSDRLIYSMTKQHLKNCILLVLLGLTLSLVLLGWDTLVTPRRYALTSTARAGFGSSGQLLLIDRGKTAIEILGDNQVLEKRLNGEDSDGFYYAEHIAQAEDGTMYISDRAYLTAGDATKTVERVLELRDRDTRTVWQSILEGSGVSDEQGAAIKELQIYDGAVYFLRAESYGLGLYRFAGDDEPALIRRIYCGDVINDASIDLSTNTIVMATRRGYVRVLKGDDRIWRTVSSDAQHWMPQCISARNGQAWVSDGFANRVCRFVPERPEEGFETVYTGDAGFIDIQASSDGSTLLASNGAGFYQIDVKGASYAGEVVSARFPLTVGLRVCLCISALIGLWLLRLVFLWFLRLLRTESVLRIVLVVIAAASVSVFVAYSLMVDLFEQEDNTLVENMKLFAESVLQGTDAEDLNALKWEQDYGTSAFMRVRRPLDSLLALAHAEENYYTYALYRLDGETLRFVMDSDDSVMCGQPYEMPDRTYLAEVQRSGKSYALRTHTAKGSFIEVLIPVADASGNRFAIMEIGLDLGLRNRVRAKAMLNMILNVICATAVVVMLVLEIIFLISFKEKLRDRQRTPGAVLDGPCMVPVRTLMFLIYTADCMQEAFIAVLCVQLYRGGLPFSDGTAAALPISAELLAMAVSSSICGRAAQRYGSRRVFTVGMTVQIIGFLICPVLGSYVGLFLGKILIGIGMGAVYVSCNTVAASGETPESSSEAFAGVAAGTISGIAAGAGLSSVFLSIGGFRLVYLISALFAFAGLLLVNTTGDVRSKPQESTLGTQEISTARFFANRRVPAFFLLILVPFMMTPSYRVYFFPIYAQEQGISEVRIGQIYLLCGLLVLYLGPKLSGVILKHLGSFWGMLSATLLAGGAMALFVAFPGVWSVITGILLVYGAFAFGSVCQYTYFQNLPECLSYGEGKSMSAFSVFENIGSTMGPMVFGTLLHMGYRSGLFVFCGALLALGALFAVLALTDGKHYN